MLTLLLDLGLDPDERDRVDGLEEVVYSWGEPLRQCAILGQPAMAEILLKRGASANTNVYAASSAMYEAYARQDRAMVELLERHGGFVDAGTAGYLGLAERLRRLFEDEAAGRLQEGMVPPGGTVAEELLFSAAASGNVDLVRMALEHLDWPRGDARWQWRLMQPLGRHPESERDRYLTCFQNDPGAIRRRSSAPFWTNAAARCGGRLAPVGAYGSCRAHRFRHDSPGRRRETRVRDDLLRSTPLGWACRWGRLELVTLLLKRGADPVEADAEPWATPLAWAEKMNRGAVLSVRTEELECAMTRELREALLLAEQSDPSVNAAALLRIARVVAKVDQSEAQRLLDRGLALLAELPDEERAAIVPQATCLAACVAPDRAFALHATTNDPFQNDKFLYDMVRHGHAAAAIELPDGVVRGGGVPV